MPGLGLELEAVDRALVALRTPSALSRTESIFWLDAQRALAERQLRLLRTELDRLRTEFKL